MLFQIGFAPNKYGGFRARALERSLQVPYQLYNGLDLKQCVYLLSPEISTAQLLGDASGSVSQPVF